MFTFKMIILSQDLYWNSKQNIVLHTFKYSMEGVLFYYIQNLIDNNHLFFHCQQLDKMNMINIY